MYGVMCDVRKRLDWLRSVAPSPADQEKYKETNRWLAPIEGTLAGVAGQYEAWKAQQAEFESQHTVIK
jgi:hypothetical protein